MINRSLIHDKFGGRCAYCGHKICIKDMQIDHLWPQFLAHRQPELDNNRSENLMPACRKCNHYKKSLLIEEFREELSKQVERLMKNAQFDRALRFGQVEIKETPIKFFFEKEDR